MGLSKHLILSYQIMVHKDDKNPETATNCVSSFISRVS